MRSHGSVAIFMLLSLSAASVSAQTTGIREVTASERSVIPLNTKIRYTTMVVLPDDEEILDVICGDRDFWVISATHNIAHVKPAKDGAATNLNLVTASGAIYSFLLTEGKSPQPDLKVYVTADSNIVRAKPKYYSATQVSALETELTEARAAIQKVELRSDEAIATFRREYPAALQFAYGTPKYEKPFFVRSIWHDGQFTYIRSDARELPTLYELRDGQPSLVNFQVESGTYVIPKVLERGYLAIGKERFGFEQGR
jgi:type IV secretion system protein VirB9